MKKNKAFKLYRAKLDHDEMVVARQENECPVFCTENENPRLNIGRRGDYLVLGEHGRTDEMGSNRAIKRWVFEAYYELVIP